LTDAFKVDLNNQQIDSVHIKSNMRRLGRIGIFVSGINKFIKNLKRQNKKLFESIPADLLCPLPAIRSHLFVIDLFDFSFCALTSSRTRSQGQKIIVLQFFQKN